MFSFFCNISGTAFCRAGYAKISVSRLPCAFACHFYRTNHTRTRLSGPFLNEPYPEYSAAYPLFPAENGALPREANTTPEDRKGTITDRLKRTAKTSGYGPKRSVSAQAQSRTLDWSGYYAKWVNGEDIPGSVGAIALRIGRGGDDANLLKTDSHVKREIARCGVVGDEDPWELRRSRTNTITRRLRLWVQWISLANCLEIVSKFHKESEEVISTPGTDPTSTFRDRREDGRRTLGEHDMGEHDVEVGNNRDELASSTADASDVQSNPTLQSPTSVKTKLTCKVTWFGKSVASFELCRRTGLPLTPGECLLALPRGVSWSSCNLRLELVAAVHVEKSKSRISRTRSVSKGSSSNCNSNSSDDSRSDDSGSDHSSQSKISSSVRSDADDHHSLDGTGDESNGSDGSSVLASAKYDEQRHGSETVLGSVMVDWKVRQT